MNKVLILFMYRNLRVNPISIHDWLDSDYEMPWEFAKHFAFGTYPETLDCFRTLLDYLCQWPTAYHWYLSTANGTRLRYSYKTNTWHTYSVGSRWQDQRPMLIE